MIKESIEPFIFPYASAFTVTFDSEKIWILPKFGAWGVKPPLHSTIEDMWISCVDMEWISFQMCGSMWYFSSLYMRKMTILIEL